MLTRVDLADKILTVLSRRPKDAILTVDLEFGCSREDLNRACKILCLFDLVTKCGNDAKEENNYRITDLGLAVATKVGGVKNYLISAGLQDSKKVIDRLVRAH